MKCLMVLNDMAWFWSHRWPLARAIKARGWELTVLCPDADKDDKLAVHGIRGIDLPRAGNVWGHIQTVRSIGAVLRAEKPDLMHAITLRHALYAGLAARLAGYTPCVFTIAGLGSIFSADTARMKLLRPVVKRAMKAAFDRAGVQVIFQNGDDHRLMVEGGVIAPARAHIVRSSGVDTDEYAFHDEAESDAPIILFASRLLKEKGIEDFVASVPMVKALYPAARFVVAGDSVSGNPYALDPAAMRRWVMEELIEWLGHVDDMPACYRAAAMVVLPSYYGEGVPKALLEAAATGRAIITTDMPGCRETVRHGYNGLLIKPRDPQGVARAIIKLLDDPERRRRMGRNGRIYVEENFTAARVTRQTMAVYDAALWR